MSEHSTKFHQNPFITFLSDLADKID